MRKRIKWLAVGSAALSLTVAAGTAQAEGSVVRASGRLRDLSAAANPTDGARARLVAVPQGDGTTLFVFIVRRLDSEAEGQTFGAHVHVGPCVAGSGGLARGHYQHVDGGGATPSNEVWLDFTVQPGGIGWAQTVVPFEIEPGDAQSVVIHALPTQPGTGSAGSRLACLPVEF